MPIISVITPVYNVEKYLKRCLNSILEQTFVDWEVVCINDGSTDDSGAILDEYKRIDPRIKVIHKEHGGVSEARNVGMSYCEGAYVMYIDSDDLIHPQTMELAYAIAIRDQSEIVCWCNDKRYRKEIRIRYKLGLKTDDVIPRGMKKLYNINRIKGHITDDVIAHLTEEANSKIKYPITHFYLWRLLIKKELLEDVYFLTGVTYEDFPWWSELVLKNPRTTITYLPLYYYFPNLNSIDFAYTIPDRLTNWIKGLTYTYDLYQSKATDYQKSQWYKNCMWPVIIHHIGKNVKKIKLIGNPEPKIKDSLILLRNKGVFDHPQTKKDREYRGLIIDYIEED